MVSPEVRAAAEIALAKIRSGWTQGQSWRIETEPDGIPRQSFCMAGANFRACGMVESRLYHDLARWQAEIIRAQYPEIDFSGRSDPAVVIHWNDTPGRTKDEVVAIYEKMLAGK